MVVRVKPRPTRLLRVGKITRKENVEREMDLVAERHIMSHPQYLVILASLREGVAVAEIARYFAQEQWITVSEKTFAEYLYVFRKRKFELVYKQIGNIEHLDTEARTIDRVVSGHQPDLDVDREMDRAIRFQKIRVGIGFNNEKTLGMPLEQVGRDVITLGKLLELKHKRQGFKVISKGLPNTMIGPLSAPVNVKDELNNVVKDQSDTDKLIQMSASLLERINNE